VLKILTRKCRGHSFKRSESWPMISRVQASRFNYTIDPSYYWFS